MKLWRVLGIPSFKFQVSSFYLLTIGFISILGQVIILRELNVAFYGVELIYILAMGVWLFWTAIGAVIGRRTYSPSVMVVRFLFVIFGILLPLEVVFIRSVRLLFGGIPGAYLPFGQQITAIILSLLPIGVLLGLLFQWAAKLYVEKDRTLAMAYAIESAGGLAGGLTSTLLLLFGVQNFTIAMVCSLLAVLSSFIRYLPKGHTPIPISSYVRTLVFLMLMLIFLSASAIDHYMTQWNHPRLVDSYDSPYSRITIEGEAGQFVVFENGVLGFDTENTAAEEFVHFAAIQHEEPARVLISGGGLEGIVREILKHKPRKVDYVELNAALFDLARKHLPENYLNVLNSKSVTVRHADPRAFLEDREPYDLILMGMSEPSSGQSNRFYTREYFKQCADKLKPGGILAFRLPSSENIWTQFLTYRNASIYLALTSVFGDVLVLPGVTNIVLASNAPLIRNPSELTERFNERQINTRLITPAYISYILTNDRFFQIPRQISSVKAPLNTDSRPVCYQYSGMIWLSKFIPDMRNWDISSVTASKDIPYLYIVPLMGLFLLARRGPKLRRITLAALAGFMGMVVETMLILHYQIKSGVLFQNIGILLMVFMAGLSAGSLAVMRLTLKMAGNQDPIQPDKNLVFSRTVRWGIGSSLFTGFGILSLVFIVLLKSGYPSGLFLVSFFQFIAGFLVSGIFAFASLSGVQDQKLVVSPLYAADLLGGCIGSLLASLLFIPFLGMEQTAAIMAVLALAALSLI
ncbi:Spermine/spermidine synthase domain-containing protein [Desulfonema magnum]|uniref:Polyamine aminopropyltransferase n=1 Tax=Desulfonema magnum TaxID=45655 RepID=A0A975GQF7_9BACT|nr:Spermine/spermidine synthase domain-containing protein [Desulfonema magnum]